MWFNIKTSKNPRQSLKKEMLLVWLEINFWLFLKTCIDLRSPSLIVVKISVTSHGREESIMKIAAQKHGKLLRD